MSTHYKADKQAARRIKHEKAGPQRGSAMVELALTLPLLIALSMAATDFGRLFYHGVTIANAAGAGAFYGARDKVLSGAFEKHMDHAKEDMTNITVDGSGAYPVEGEAEQYCKCPAPDNTVINCAELLATECTSYGPPRAYIKVTIKQRFPTLVPWPFLPDNTDVERVAYQRLQ